MMMRSNILLQRMASALSRAVQNQEHGPRESLAGAEQGRDAALVAGAGGGGRESQMFGYWRAKSSAQRDTGTRQRVSGAENSRSSASFEARTHGQGDKTAGRLFG